MCRSLLFLLALTLPAYGEEPLSGTAFEAFATGKTLSYALGGTVYGAEQYLPGRQVIWAFRGQECRKGFWYEEAGQICFVYEDEPDAQCWTFSRDGDRLQARFSGDPEGAEAVQVQESAALACPGPDLGV